MFGLDSTIPSLGLLLLSVLQLAGTTLGHGAPSYGADSSHHHDPEERPTSFHDPKVVQDTDHILEHYEGLAKLNESAMSPEELEFHYFKLHDFDNNTKLDGLEIYKALTHLLPYQEVANEINKDSLSTKGKTTEQIRQEKKAAEDQYYTDIVDTVLKEDDLDDDGYLTYAEYVLARRREEAREAAERRKTK